MEKKPPEARRKAQKRVFPRPSEERGLLTPDSRLPASRAETINVILSHPVGGN